MSETGRLPLFRQRVRDEWIDYNGHLSEAFYVLVFGYATDALLDATGMGAAYREASGCSLYTVEAHVRYLDEVQRGSDLTVRTRVLGVDRKKARFLHEMYVLPPDVASVDGVSPVATEELLAVHVDQRAGAAAPLPDAVAGRFGTLVEPVPDGAGRAIGPVPKG